MTQENRDIVKRIVDTGVWSQDQRKDRAAIQELWKAYTYLMDDYKRMITAPIDPVKVPS